MKILFKQQKRVITKRLVGFALLNFVLMGFTTEVMAEDKIKRTYNIQDVSALRIMGKGTLDIELGNSESLVVIGPRSYLESLHVSAVDDVLKIDGDDEAFWAKAFREGDIHFHLTMKSLSSISAGGNLLINLTTPIRDEQFEVRLAGPIEFNMPDLTLDKKLDVQIYGPAKLNGKTLRARELDVKAFGPAEVTIKGEVKQQDLVFTGPIVYKGEYLHSQISAAKLMGPSDVSLWVDRKLTVSAMGASHVQYYGKAEVDSKNIMASDVEYQGDSPTP